MFLELHSEIININHIISISIDRHDELTRVTLIDGRVIKFAIDYEFRYHEIKTHLINAGIFIGKIESIYRRTKGNQND